MDRNREYDGQPHTDHGERGKTLVEGLTMRDVVDCFVMAVMDSIGGDDMEPQLHEKAQNGLCEYGDLHKIKDQNKIDLTAVSQNLGCRLEKMMGIFPNLADMETEEC